MRSNDTRGKIARRLQRRQRLGDAVATPQRLQVGIVQRLHADGDAVDARAAIAAKPARLDAGGVRLQRDLGVGSIAQCLPIVSRIAPTVRGGISEGVPPPKKIERTAGRASRAARCAISARRRRRTAPRRAASRARGC